ncbi:hypothetical protein M231_04234 [Tremella mesenterica]|uniref:Uncharacterized protein n=1 Tax=Tremella mesenterica TaxID=5217 RepID=A0A4Q1BL09_TREME|nr:hypothetical protein M231_04234 [Tremella mesenterica]
MSTRSSNDNVIVRGESLNLTGVTSDKCIPIKKTMNGINQLTVSFTVDHDPSNPNNVKINVTADIEFWNCHFILWDVVDQKLDDMRAFLDTLKESENGDPPAADVIATAKNAFDTWQTDMIMSLREVVKDTYPCAEIPFTIQSAHGPYIGKTMWQFFEEELRDIQNGTGLFKRVDSVPTRPTGKCLPNISSGLGDEDPPEPPSTGSRLTEVSESDDDDDMYDAMWTTDKGGGSADPRDSGISLSCEIPQPQILGLRGGLIALTVPTNSPEDLRHSDFLHSE